MQFHGPSLSRTLIVTVFKLTTIGDAAPLPPSASSPCASLRVTRSRSNDLTNVVFCSVVRPRQMRMMMRSKVMPASSTLYFREDE